jgi:F-type H+-transporting ATPase subunit a
MENPVLFHLGPLAINDAVVTTWVIMALLAVFSLLVTRRLQLQPGPLQTALEGSLGAIDDAVRAVLPEQADKVLPFFTTLWLFLVVANLSGIIPGVHAPTGHLSTTAALAILVFLSVHWFGIRNEGLKTYLSHYLRPTPLLLPFHIISEITRTAALAVRLFGNIMSLEMAALLILLVAGFLAPVPILMLHIVEALVQAYIFGMLALIYIAGAMQSHQLHRQREKE